MKVLAISFVFLFVFCNGFSQTTKVAILDFENVSGAAEYESWGKALSNMLITDLANNIHPKKVEFFERSQLNKLLDEQSLQKSKNFDSKTAVDFGKLSGVNFVFVGSVFVVGKTCSFSSKLVDVQTSKILLAKDVSGNVEDFLKLKTELAEAIANQLSYPIFLEPAYKELSTTPATINQYLKILTTMDAGDMEKAEEMRSLFEETNPEFRYFADVKEDIEELKKQVAQNTKDIEVLNKSGGRVVNAQTLNELWINIANPLTSYEDRKIYMTSIMKFETYEIEKILPEFNNVCIMPAGLEIYDQSEDVYLRDLEYLTDLLSEKDINTRTVSYYAYYYLRAIPTEHVKQIVPKVIEVCELLEEFNKKNRIEEYDLEVFGGSYAFYFNRGGDLNLSVQHLIELLKGEM
jgi:TolB-like protein